MGKLLTPPRIANWRFSRGPIARRPSPLPRLRWLRYNPPASHSVRYRVFPINKSYLVTTLPMHTWSYTLPDLAIGSFVKMVSGVFMQRGDVVTMLNLFKHLRGLQSLSLSAQSTYKVIDPSFPATMSPTAIVNTRPLPVYACRPLALALGLKRRAAGGRKRANILLVQKSKAKKARYPSRRPRIIRLFRLKKRLKRLSLFLRGRKPRLRPRGLRPRLSIPRRVAGLSVEVGSPRVSLTYPRQSALSIWNLLYQQPLLNYSLKYCRLSRRVRKILKNKYRYSKYYFVIAPYKRRLFTLHLWKYVLKFHDERTFLLKFEALLKNFTNPDADALLWSLFYTQQRLALKKLLGR